MTVPVMRDCADFPWHLSVEVDYTELADNEMPTLDESELLNKTCDQIEPAVLEPRTKLDAVNALILARSTWGGIRELAFQVHDPETVHQSLQELLKSREWERHWQYEMRSDPSWKSAGHFFRLFPLARGDDA